MKSRGVELIAAERQRQIDVEGWTPEHDAQHTDGELADAAAAYALSDHWPITKRDIWPWAPEWYKPKDRIRDLVRAGALIAAEIDRLLAQEGGADGLRGHHAATEALLREREEENQRIRHLLSEIERGTDDIREGLHGCGDHSCMVKKPLGMATNGGCRCVTNNTFEVRVLLGRALRKAARLEEENRRLREALGWLVHLNRGVSRGGGQPTKTEWADAWEHAEQLLRGEQP